MSISDREIQRPQGTGGRSHDQELVEAHQAGDPDAFGDIVRAYYPQLLGHAVRRLRDPRAAEDAVQEALLRSYRGLGAFNGDYQLRAWLHRILANVCTDEGTRRRRESAAHERWSARPDTVDLSVEERCDYAEAHREVAQAISRLPDSYREALVLRDVLELGYAEVASRAGITEQNARARVHRARAALRRMVDSSLGIAVVFGGGIRRSWRWVPRLSCHIANSANAVTEAVTMPARSSATMAAFASTSATVAAVAAVTAGPLLATLTPPPPAPPAVTIAAPARPPGSAAIAGLAQPVAATLGPIVKSSTTTAPPTSTTSTTLAHILPAVGSGAPSARVLGVLDSSPVPTDLGGATTEEAGQLELTGAAPAVGTLSTQLLLPSSGASVCTGSLKTRFMWAGGSTTRTLSVVTTFLSVATHAGVTVYELAGATDPTGVKGTFDHSTAIKGTLTVPADGSGGTLSLKFLDASPVAPAPACPAPGSSSMATTVPADPSATSTTVPAGPSATSTTVPAGPPTPTTVPPGPTTTSTTVAPSPATTTPGTPPSA